MLQTLKNRNFLLIIIAKLISLMGDSVFDLAIMWYVLDKFGKTSGVMLAMIMTMSILPKVVLGSLAGSIVDRYNKKYILILSDSFAGFAVIVVFFLMGGNGAGSVVLLSAIAILAVTSSTVRIAVSSMIPQMFSGKELYDANGLNQFVERGTALLGYALGGGLIAIVGVKTAILLNAVSFIICAIMETFLKLKNLKDEEIGKEQGEGQKNSLRTDFIEVKSFLSLKPVLLRIVLVFTTINFLLDPILNIVLPFALKNTFHANSTNLGLVIASLPLGFCVGAVFFSKRPGYLMNRYVLYNSILFLNLTSLLLLLIFAIPSLLPGKNVVVVYFMFCLFIEGIFSAAINIGTSTYLQQNVPSSIRGKFFGVSSSLSAGLIPLGSLIAGALIGVVEASFMFAFVIVAIFVILYIVPKTSYSFENFAENSNYEEAVE